MTMFRFATGCLAAGVLAGGGYLVRSGNVPVPTAPSPAQQDLDEYNAPYDGQFHFVRVRFQAGSSSFGFGRGRGGRGEPPWAHDYPRAEYNFLKIIDETTFIGTLTDGTNILTLDDPRLFQYPIAYIVEVGLWGPTDEEVQALGDYLRKGGFLIVDDFGGPWELGNLEFHINRALPGAQLVRLDESHEIFDSFFRINPQAVVPPYSRGRGAPEFLGIYEDNDESKRLLAIVNYNNDIAEYWEFSDYGYYPIDLSNEAYKLGVNYIVYGMTH
jgi:hypothetical protein